MKTIKQLEKLDLTCKSLHLKEYNACLINGKTYVIYEGIKFTNIKYLKAYISLKKRIESLKNK